MFIFSSSFVAKKMNMVKPQSLTPNAFLQGPRYWDEWVGGSVTPARGTSG
jgi:hypothetical protein